MGGEARLNDEDRDAFERGRQIGKKEVSFQVWFWVVFIGVLLFLGWCSTTA